jgi:AraC-like DNA-binding protein/mannose-6-phosphate isomerase-like protein (cupin superfamily)
MTREARPVSDHSGKALLVREFDRTHGRHLPVLAKPLFERAREHSGILSAPSFLYGEDKPGAIFGFFHIEALSARNNDEEGQTGLHRHPDFDQIVIIAEGGCRFEHDGREIEVGAPCCVYTPANVIHRFFYRSDVRGVVISVSSDFVAGLSSAEHGAVTTMLRLGACRVIRFRTQDTIDAAQGLIDLTLDKFASRHPHRCDIVRYLFGGLLLELAAAVEVPSHDDARTMNAVDLFRRFNDLVQETIGTIGFGADARPPSCTVESFAHRVSTTPYALNVACQTVCGCSARDLINNAILDQATRLLLYTSRPMKDISYLLGYSHASHFTRFFKQRRGTTPEVFRSQAPRDKWVELPR